MGLQKCFRKRLQKAGMGLWEELLQEYTEELANTQASGEGVKGSDFSRLVPQAHEDVDVMKMAARKIGGGGSWRHRQRQPRTLRLRTWRRSAMMRRNGPTRNSSVRALGELPRNVGTSRDRSQGGGEEAQHGGSGGTQPADKPRRGSGDEAARRDPNCLQTGQVFGCVGPCVTRRLSFGPASGWLHSTKGGRSQAQMRSQRAGANCGR